jgi:hypothetical protein
MDIPMLRKHLWPWPALWCRPAVRLRRPLRIREVNYTKGQTALALKEATLQ